MPLITAEEQPGPILLTAGNSSAFLRNDGTFTVRNMPSFMVWGRRPEGGLFPGPLRTYRIRARVGGDEVAASTLFTVPPFFGSPRPTIQAPLLKADLANSPEITGIRLVLEPAVALASSAVRIHVLGTAVSGSEIELPLSERVALWSSPIFLAISDQRELRAPGAMQSTIAKTWIVASYLGLSAQAQLTILSPPNQDHDGDADGMSDAWERLYGLNPADPADGLLDPDRDSLANVEESVLGTNPLHDDSDEDGLRDDVDPQPLIAERVPPTILFLSPAANQMVDPRDPDFQIMGQVADDVQLRNASVDIGSASYAIAAPGSFAFTQLLSALSPVPDGATTIIMSATDRAGNRTTARRSIIVATMPPKVRIVTPDGSENLAPGSSPEVRVTASDDRSVASVDLLVNGVIAAHLTSPPYRAAITIPLDATRLTLMARAVDDLGNTAEDSRSYTLTTQDAAGPIIHMQPGDGFVAATGAVVTVDITATDPSGVTSLDLAVDAGTVERPDPRIPRWLWTMPSSVGIVHGHVSATDAPGNASERDMTWHVTLPEDAISFVSPSADSVWIAGCLESARIAIPRSIVSGMESRVLLNGVSTYAYQTGETLPDGRAILYAPFEIPAAITTLEIVVDVTAPGIGLRRLRRTVRVEPWPGVEVSGTIYRSWDDAGDAPGLVWLDTQTPAVIAPDGTYTLYLSQPPSWTWSSYADLSAARLDAWIPSAGTSALRIDSLTARTGRVAGQDIHLSSRPGARLSDGASASETGWPLPFDPDTGLDVPTRVRVSQNGTLFYGPTAATASIQVGGQTLSAAATSMSTLPEDLSVIVNQGSWSRMEWVGDANQGLATWFTSDQFSSARAVQVWLRRGFDPVVVNRAGNYATDGPLLHASKRASSGGRWRGIALDPQTQLAILHDTAIERYAPAGDGRQEFIAHWWNDTLVFQDEVTSEGGYTGATELSYREWYSSEPSTASAFDGWTNGSIERLQRSVLVTQVISDGAPVQGAVIRYAGHEVRTDDQGFALLHSANIQPPPEVARLFVRADATGTGDGSSWTNAFTTLDAAIAAVRGMWGAEIWVAQGTYRPSAEMIPGDPRSASFHFTSSAAWYGGFIGTETDRRQADPARHPTVLTGDLGVVGDRSDNARVVASTENYLYLDGFVFIGGEGGSGAGLHLQRGGSMSRCVIRDNHAGGEEGGGIATAPFASLTLDRCLVIGNSARRGGGMALRDAYAEMSNTVFLANAATESGSAISITGVDPVLSEHAHLALRSCTVVDGDASAPGVGLITHHGLDWKSSLSASIILPRNGANAEEAVPSQAACTWCISTVTLPGEGTNLVGTPAFRDMSTPAGDDGWWGTADDGLVLAEGSLGLDALTVLQVGEVTDLTGSSRSAGAAPDIGAYERDGTPVVLTYEDFIRSPYEQPLIEASSMTITSPVDPDSSVTVPVVGIFPNQINILPPVVLPIPGSLGSLNVRSPGRAVAGTAGGK